MIMNLIVNIIRAFQFLKAKRIRPRIPARPLPKAKNTFNFAPKGRQPGAGISPAEPAAKAAAAAGKIPAPSSFRHRQPSRCPQPPPSHDAERGDRGE